MSRNRFEIKRALAALVGIASAGLGVRHVAADAPVGRYTIAGGTVLDTKTKLTWQQTVPATPVFSWSAAVSYCQANPGELPGSGWRLPSLTELQTIIDDSQANPAIDPNAFPGTPSVIFWTGSAYSAAAGVVWGVDFADGQTVEPDVATKQYLARCVR